MAEKSGYRPCLRCRPESAPQSPAWIGKSAVVQRALKLIGNHGAIDKTEEKFVAQFGMSARHLRRLFETELGKTPKQISDLNRLNFGRKLITETSLPMTEIAFASGFSSLRRFNDAMKKRFHRSPSQLRSLSKASFEPDGVKLRISYRPPLDWNSLMNFYRSHTIRPIETVTQDTYSRPFSIDGTVGSIVVEPSEVASELFLTVQMENPRALYAIVQRVRNMFDLECDPIVISNTFSTCKIMKRLDEKFPGLRLPRGFDPFETSICSILGQLVSTEQAGRLIEQLVTNYGEKVKSSSFGRDIVLFPSAKTLAKESLVHVKTTEARRLAIKEFSQAVLDKKIHLDATQDPHTFREQLLRIKGIAPWTAHYVSLRAIGDTDAFPASDLILRRVLQTQSDLKIESFKPWRAYAGIYLWKEFALELSKKQSKRK